MHQTEFKCHRARIIKAFKVESSKFALLCFRVTAATFMSSVHHQLFVQEKYQRVLLSSASGWRKTLYHSDSMIQVNSSSRVCAASCKRPAVLGNFSRVKLFFLMSFIPSPKMSLCLCSLFLSWRLNLPLQRQRLFCVVTRRKESLKSNPGCSADRPRRHVSPSSSCFLSDFFVKSSFLAVAESNQPRGASSQTREEIEPRSISTTSNTRMSVTKVCFHTANKISEILIPACGDQLQMFQSYSLPTDSWSH